MEDEAKINPLQSIDSTDVYKEALNRAFEELAKIKEQKKEIAVREAQLNETLRALMPLAGLWKTDLEGYSLSNAVRFIFNGLGPDRALTAIEVRGKLQELGYDLSEHENPLASIHTCMRRMIDSEELALIQTDANQKKFEPGPELKSVPEPAMITDSTGQMLALSDLINYAQEEDKEE